MNSGDDRVLYAIKQRSMKTCTLHKLLKKLFTYKLKKNRRIK